MKLSSLRDILVLFDVRPTHFRLQVETNVNRIKQVNLHNRFANFLTCRTSLDLFIVFRLFLKNGEFIERAKTKVIQKRVRCTVERWSSWDFFTTNRLINRSTSWRTKAELLRYPLFLQYRLLSPVACTL